MENDRSVASHPKPLSVWGLCMRTQKSHNQSKHAPDFHSTSSLTSHSTEYSWLTCLKGRTPLILNSTVGLVLAITHLSFYDRGYAVCVLIMFLLFHVLMYIVEIKNATGLKYKFCGNMTSDLSCIFASQKLGKHVSFNVARCIPLRM